MLDPRKDTIRSVAGNGRAAFADGKGAEAALSEPGGLSIGPEGSVLVADTNNHLVRIFHPADGRLRTLELRGVPPPRVSPNAVVAEEDALSSGAPLVKLDPIRVRLCPVKVVVNWAVRL